MDKHRFGVPLRLMAFSTAALTLTLGIVVPMMDAVDDFAGPTVEAGHHGSACVLHDHSLCIQAGANQSLAGDVHTTGHVPAVIPWVMRVSAGPVSGPLHSEPSPARAPPHRQA